MKKKMILLFLFLIMLAPISVFAYEDVAGCGVLGGVNSKTASLISWLIKLIRIGIPVLVIILGTTDFLKILFSGEEKVFKEAFARFVKRLGIGMSILFLPYILLLLVRLSGVDKQYSIDNLYCGILEQTSGVKGTTPTIPNYSEKVACEEITSLAACNDPCELANENGEVVCKNKICYYCPTTDGSEDHFWQYPVPSGRNNCTTIPVNTKDECFHG